MASEIRCAFKWPLRMDGFKKGIGQIKSGICWLGLLLQVFYYAFRVWFLQRKQAGLLAETHRLNQQRAELEEERESLGG